MLFNHLEEWCQTRSVIFFKGFRNLATWIVIAHAWLISLWKFSFVIFLRMVFVWIPAPFFWWQRQLVDIAANVGELIWLSLVAYCVCLSHHLRGVTFQKLFIKDVDCFVVNNVWRCEFHEEYRIRLQRWSWILPLLQTILLRKYHFGKKRTSLDLSDWLSNCAEGIF